MTSTTTTTSLPLIGLSYPTILFPSSKITIPVNKEIAQYLSSHSTPLIAAVPISQNNSLSEYATVSRLLRITPTDPYFISLHGLSRVQLISPIPSLQSLQFQPLQHQVQYPPPSDIPPDPDILAKFKDAALRLLDRLARDSTTYVKRDAYLKLASMIDELVDQRPSWLADVFASSVPGEYSDKLALLSTPSLSERLQLATIFFTRYTSISEVTKKIASAVDESLSRQQKEFFLRQQLTAIQRELHSLSNSNPSPPPLPPSNTDASASELDDDDAHEASDLADLKAKIEAMLPGSEERKMGVREWKRLQRIPAGSVENGVVRSYVNFSFFLSSPLPLFPNDQVPSTHSSINRLNG